MRHELLWDFFFSFFSKHVRIRVGYFEMCRLRYAGCYIMGARKKSPIAANDIVVTYSSTAHTFGVGKCLEQEKK